MKEKVLQNTQIRNMHEMGEITRAEKITRQLSSSHPNCSKCKNEFCEWFRWFSRCGIELQWKIFSSSQFNQQSFQVLVLCWAAKSACHLIHGICLDHRKTFFGSPRPMFGSSQTLYEGILHSTTPSATGAVPVQVSTGQLVARGEERTGSTTTMPMSERRPSTMHSFLPVEIPQSRKTGQQRHYRYRSFNLVN